MTQSHKYSRCPDCGRKSVYFVARPHEEDDYECRYRDCDFFFYTRSGAAVDANNERRWKEAQRGDIEAELPDLSAGDIAALVAMAKTGIEYARINNLGGSDTDDMKLALAAIAKVVGAEPSEGPSTQSDSK